MMQMPLTWEHKKEDIFRKNFLKSVGNTNENSRNFTPKDEGGGRLTILHLPLPTYSPIVNIVCKFYKILLP